jgi:hypothetical protein
VTTDAKNSPATRTAAAEHMQAERAMIATLLAGTGAMRKAGQLHLPKHPAESPEAYAYRLSVSTLYNGMKRTIGTLAGKPFAEPLTLGDTVPPAIAEWCEDIDLQGRDLQAFSHAAFQQALADGLTHILVEYPKTTPGATLADKKATGARPYFVHLKHDQILGWRSERVAGVETLTQLRFMETVEEPDGLYAVASVPQVRVLERTDVMAGSTGKLSWRWVTFRTNDKGEWLQHDTGPLTLGAIALATIYTGRTAFMQATPPLLDLAWLNIEHWQSSSDQSNILHVARVPLLFAAGFAEGKLTIGAGSAISNDEPTAKLSYVEHSGAAIAAGRDSIKDIEERMSLMGAQLLARRAPGNKTATEDAIDSAESDSDLAQMVRNCEDSLELALQFAADWETLGPAGTLKLTGDIGGLGDLDLQALMQARQLGILSAETVHAELQRRGIVDESVTWAIESERLKNGPPLPSSAPPQPAKAEPT